MSSKKIINNYIFNTIYQVLILAAPLVTMPYVSRVLGVTNVSIYDYCHSFATYSVLIGAVGTTLYGQREIAYLQDNKDKRTQAFFEIEVFRIISVALFSTGYFFLFCTHGEYSYVHTILLIEVIAAAFDISWLFMGMEDFGITVLRNSIIKVIGIVCIFLFVKSDQDLIIYVFCLVLPIGIGNLSLWASLRKYVSLTDFDLAKTICGIRERIKPIFLLFIPQIAADVYMVLDKSMIGLLSPTIDQVGYYSYAQKIVKLFLMLVNSMGVVILPAMSAEFARGKKDVVVNRLEKVFQFTYCISFPMMIGLDVVAHRFVPVYLGAGYEPVIFLIIVISPIIAIIATSNIIGRQYLLPANEQNIFTKSIVVGATVNFVLNLILIPRFQALGASIATVIAELFVTIVQCWHTKEKLPLKGFFISGCHYMAYALLMGAGVSLIDYLLPPKGILPLVLCIASGFVLYFLMLVLRQDKMIQEAKGILKRYIHRK